MDGTGGPRLFSTRVSGNTDPEPDSGRGSSSEDPRVGNEDAYYTRRRVFEQSLETRRQRQQVLGNHPSPPSPGGSEGGTPRDDTFDLTPPPEHLIPSTAPFRAMIPAVPGAPTTGWDAKKIYAFTTNLDPLKLEKVLLDSDARTKNRREQEQNGNIIAPSYIMHLDQTNTYAKDLMDRVRVQALRYGPEGRRVLANACSYSLVTLTDRIPAAQKFLEDLEFECGQYAMDAMNTQHTTQDGERVKSEAQDWERIRTREGDPGLGISDLGYEYREGTLCCVAAICQMTVAARKVIENGMLATAVGLLVSQRQEMYHLRHDTLPELEQEAGGLQLIYDAFTKTKLKEALADYAGISEPNALAAAAEDFGYLTALARNKEQLRYARAAWRLVTNLEANYNNQYEQLKQIPLDDGYILSVLGPTPSTPNMRWGPPVDPSIPMARPVYEDTAFEVLVRAAHNRRVQHIADLREQQRQFARRMADEEYEEAQYDVLMRDLPFGEARDDNERE